MLRILLLFIPLLQGVVGEVACTDQVVTDIKLQTEAAQDEYDSETELKTLMEIEPEASRQTVLGYSMININPPNYSEVKYSPCLTVDKNDVAGHKVVILAQPYPLGEGFCVDSDMDGFARQCNVNEFKWCNDVVDGAQFQFSCYQQSCEKSSINILVKMVVSESNEGGEVEYWCDSTNDTYPSSLIRTKPNVAPDYEGQDPSQNKEAKEDSSAFNNTAQLFILCVAFFIPCFF
ncbi:uncharacterized protein LOC134820127 [Bolinopsis microptera]|uniref:uncharacterized protein LOC134820127 n=1 Tax=Bolinopsis microptera TaxID=2820187 RepID=UPI0030796C00